MCALTFAMCIPSVTWVMRNIVCVCACRCSCACVCVFRASSKAFDAFKIFVIRTYKLL